EKIKQAPEFFRNSPILIDLQSVHEQELNLALLVDAIRNAEVFPIGVRGGTEAQKQTAKDLMLPVISIQSRTDNQQPIIKETKLTPPPAKEKDESSIIQNTMIDQPVRSGQRIYVKGDLTITAQVSAGAEVMAEGSIHIYGALRGRALAGVQGDEKACIFCSDLQAELVSIAGNYRISEDIEDSVRNTPVQIYLNKQALIIKNI
ncbi:MAG: septum site-determining protein MinC, partial [Methyloprofundus sp.]|nr:septum site-determining protein MinC [Methyloprofundus sp.]